MINQRKIDRKTDRAQGPCACCGTQGTLTLQATPAGSGAPVTLCAACIVALARALADER